VLRLSVSPITRAARATAALDAFDVSFEAPGRGFCADLDFRIRGEKITFGRPNPGRAPPRLLRLLPTLAFGQDVDPLYREEGVMKEFLQGRRTRAPRIGRHRQLVCGLVALFVAGVFAAGSAAPTSAADPPGFLIAEVPLQPLSGTADGHLAPDAFRLIICTGPPVLAGACGTSPASTQPRLIVPLSDLSPGMTTWFDPPGDPSSSAGFFAAVTDGIVDMFNWQITDANGSFGWFGPTEPDFYGDQVGPNGVDLGGLPIQRIGVRTDAVSVSYPTATQTSVSWGGALLFEATFPTKAACKHGGWQRLLRADGSPFKNQGDCIQYFNTGK
jgi:hypothetical protein